MKFNFKIQQYQTDAVDAVVRVFNGQAFGEKVGYIRDIGVQEEKEQLTMASYDDVSDIGYKNEAVSLSNEQLLKNIQELQSENNIKLSEAKEIKRLLGDIIWQSCTLRAFSKAHMYILRLNSIKSFRNS